MKIITITSGKGGVGKTNIAVNMAVTLASSGYRTCLFDADIGLANVNILMGLVGDYTLEDVMTGHKKLSEVIIKDWNGIDIIPGSTGVEHFETLEGKSLENLIKEFSGLEGYDYIIVDTGAGISKSVVSFCLASSLLVVTIVPEPTSLTDAYSLLKVLTFNGFRNKVNIIVNRSKSKNFGKKVFDKFSDTVNKYINLKLNYLGMLPEDDKVSESVSAQAPFILKYPEASVSKALEEIRDFIIKTEHEMPHEEKSMDSFIKTCSDFFQTSLKLLKKNSAENKKKGVDKEEKRENFKPDSEEEGTQKEIVNLLRKLVENTDKISRDINLLKNKSNGAEINSDIVPPEENKNEDKEKKSPTPVLSLDFEKFVTKKNKS